MENVYLMRGNFMTNKRILLIDPAGVLMGLNIGLGYIAGALSQKGFKTKVLDLNNYRVEKPKELLRYVVTEFFPDLIGFSVQSLTYKLSIELAKFLSTFSNIPIVFGGVHTSVDIEKILKYHECVDFLVIGEGEITLCELAKKLNSNTIEEISSINGLVYRAENGTIIINPPRNLIRDLDEIPFPKYDLFGIKQITHYTLLTSRGCPYTCSFCLASKLLNRTWRPQKPIHLIEEIKQAKKQYNIRSFNIMDDNFTLKPERVWEFCELYLKENLDIPWECSNGIRGDKMNFELLKKKKEAGCFSVSLGLESFDQEVFSRIKKKETIEDIVHAVKILKELDIKVIGFFIIGLPVDTYEKTMYSYRRSLEMRFNRTVWQTLIPFPGTDVFEWVKHYGNYCSDYTTAATRLGEVIFETKNFSKEERAEAYEKLVTKTLQYPINPYLSKTKNILNIFRLIFKYDIEHIMKHVLHIFKKTLLVLLKGKSTVLSKVFFRGDIYPGFPIQK